MRIVGSARLFALSFGHASSPATTRSLLIRRFNKSVGGSPSTLSTALHRRTCRLRFTLFKGLAGARVQYAGNLPEIDHIFPRAELRRKGWQDEDINAFANFWILARGKNRNKSNKHPKQYFDDVDDQSMRRALIDRAALDYRRYPTFLRDRRESMLSALSKKTGLSDANVAE